MRPCASRPIVRGCSQAVGAAARRRPAWPRRLHAAPRGPRPVESAAPSAGGRPCVDAFRQTAFVPRKPLVFRAGAASPTARLPAARTWFAHPARALASRLDAHDAWPLPYELVQSSPHKREAVAAFRDWLLQSTAVADHVMAGILQAALADGQGRQFSQLCAPLRLLSKALEFNQLQQSRGSSTLELYIAQSSLDHLPQPLQEDLPTPELVQRAARGDVYSSSIWLGTEPTYTPLHRDPNPNLFCQLCGNKAVRLLPQALGDRLYFELQVKLRRHGSSRIRTTDMMEGEERAALHDAVWTNDELPDELYETLVGPGDALFIPDGWWHSVRSVGQGGQLNGSVNWWFR